MNAKTNMYLLKLTAILLFFQFCSYRYSVIPQKKMKLILWDIMTADELYAQQKLKDTTNIKHPNNATLYKEIFAIHKVTKEAFAYSFEKYKTSNDQMKELIDSLNVYAIAMAATVAKTTTTPSKIVPTVKRNNIKQPLINK